MTAEEYLTKAIGIGKDAPPLTPVDKGECIKLMEEFAQLKCKEQRVACVDVYYRDSTRNAFSPTLKKKIQDTPLVT